MNNTIIELRNRIESLHEFKLRQIDDNKKISRRVDEIDKKINETQLDLESHCEASIIDNEYADEQIRSKFKEIDDLKSKFADLEKQIKELKRFQDITHKQYQNRKKPHKCPVCEGTRYSKPEFITAMSVDGVQCKVGDTIFSKSLCGACEGKGIVCG
jgi:predicted RNase H-like nuclease (RuvC/YqgF family)